MYIRGFVFQRVIRVRIIIVNMMIAKPATEWSIGFLLFCLFAILSFAKVNDTMAQPATNPSATIPVYIGTFAGHGSKGIYLAYFNAQDGSLTAPELAGAAPSPNFLAMHPNHRFLYAVVETGPGGEKPGVAAFSIDDASCKLTMLNRQPAGGGGPCHLSIDNAGHNVLVANYNTGSVAVLPIADDGTIKESTCVIQHHGKSVDPHRQQGPHAHAIVLDAANRFVFVPDLGLDKVCVYGFDPKAGKLIANDPPAADLPPGAGPRVIAFDSSNKFAYVVSEMASTITTFAYDPAKGTLRSLQTLPMLPANYQGNHSAAAVVLHPSGKFVYASNRGPNSIAAYSRDPSTGLLTYLSDNPTGGKTPRHFAIDPTGQYLIAANQDSNNLVVFHIDPATGGLKQVGPTVDVPTPVCVLFAH
jgi:6-phosphogluconolactonase